MPSRRRATPISAYALSTSRLPIGMPCLTPEERRSSSRSTDQSPSGARLHSRRISSQGFPGDAAARDRARVATSLSSDGVQTANMSLAEAKLERQKRRNAQADQLAHPLPIDRRQGSRILRKQTWKPFDISNPSEGASEGVPVDPIVSAPVSEVRINRFHSASRTSSVSRSVSALSHRTSETGRSDLERSDSTLRDAGGFQLYKGRRQRRVIQDEERQTTVEAAFDEREVYDVFGNALPGPEFIEENVGFKDGQVQFLQHPNGDVSAQQWSQKEYQWLNIGQFSNIRKKVEGQLAADRLRGENAYQTLHYNTLLYFRNIAKQREATVMGLPFGTKEIEATMPGPSNASGAAVTRSKEAAQGTAHQHKTPDKGRTPSPDFHDLRNASIRFGAHRAYHSSMPANVPLGPRAEGPHVMFMSKSRSIRQDDPFSSTNHVQRPQSLLYASPYRGQKLSTQSSMYVPTVSHSLRKDVHTESYDLRYHPTNATDAHGPDTGLPRTFITQIPAMAQASGRWQHEYRKQMPSYTPPTDPLRLSLPRAFDDDSYVHEDAQRSGVHITATPTDQSVSFGSRTAMRPQIFQLPEAAKERSPSQANIRTVLYDPFSQSNSSAAQASTNEPILPFTASTTRTITSAQVMPVHKAVKSLCLEVPSNDPQSPSEQGSASLIDHDPANNLQESSPDTHWKKRPCDRSTPLMSATTVPEPAPQTSSGPLWGDIQHRQSVGIEGNATVAVDDIARSRDAELNDWWTSGNKFARHEEFFQSIVSLPPANPPTRHPRLVPGDTPHAGRSATKNVTPPNTGFSTSATRLLIPVLDNLASYVQGPVDKRRDYFSQWSQPPEWCIDRSETGNHSFFDAEWGQPPARVGRDPRYTSIANKWPNGSAGVGSGSPLGLGRLDSGIVGRPIHIAPRYGSASSGGGSLVVGSGVGLDRRLAFGGRV